MMLQMFDYYVLHNKYVSKSKNQKVSALAAQEIYLDLSQTFYSIEMTADSRQME